MSDFQHPALQHTPVLIVGMARSGTTLASHILGLSPDVRVEIEPHALWHTGNYKYLNDEDYDITPAIVRRIRRVLTADLGGKRLVEKSPINSLRPDLVHAVFPDARIVYIERDPVECIYSNYKRSKKQDSFKLSIVLRKYFVQAGTEDLPAATSTRSLFGQLALGDYPAFFRYVLKMFALRRSASGLPFGPKLRGFQRIVEAEGLVAYHVRVYEQSQRYKARYAALYGEQMSVFRLESLLSDRAELERLLGFAGIPFDEQYIGEVLSTFRDESERPSRADEAKAAIAAALRKG